MSSRVKSGEVPEQVLLRHAGPQVLEHVAYRDAQATNAGLAAAFSGLDRDPVQVAAWSQPTKRPTPGQVAARPCACAPFRRGCR